MTTKSDNKNTSNLHSKSFAFMLKQYCSQMLRRTGFVRRDISIFINAPETVVSRRYALTRVVRLFYKFVIVVEALAGSRKFLQFNQNVHIKRSKFVSDYSIRKFSFANCKQNIFCNVINFFSHNHNENPAYIAYNE